MATSFKEELEETLEDTKGWGRRNFIYAHLVFAVSVVASFLASAFTAADLAKEYKAAVAILAALPGLMLVVNSTLRFEERTRWFWKKTRMAERYYRQLRDSASPDVERLSNSYSDEAERLEREWPAFGASPGQPRPSEQQ